jgi:hypothetical protein
LTAIVGAAALLATIGAAANGPGIWAACTIDSVSICAASGCKAARPSVSIYLSDFVDHGVERGAYYRCSIGLTRCDRYNALVNKTGDFTIFSLPDRSVFAKLGPGHRVTDVAAMGDTVLVSRGRCSDRVPPALSELRSR